MMDLPVPEGIYEDAKKLLRKAVEPVALPLRKRRERKALLESFSERFTSHPSSITDFVNYIQWHEEDADWKQGSGLLASATYGEIFRLWTVADLFVVYEAHLLRFLRKGGETRRVFLVRGEVGDPIRLLALERTMFRHQLLGFKPKVASVVHLQDEMKKVGVRCEMFGILNSRIAYFFQFPINQEPLMLRTIEPTIVQQAENHHHRIFEIAELFETWYKRQRIHLPLELREQVETECQWIHAAAKAPSAGNI